MLGEAYTTISRRPMFGTIGRRVNHAKETDPLPLADVPPLEACSLSRTRNGITILEGVDLTISAGEIVALRGANGSGKTTLLHCLAGCLRPTTGEVLWFGQSPRRRLASRSYVGLAAHETFLYSELTARENLTFAARMYHVSGAEQRAEEMLCASQLESHAEQPAGRLSRGLQQRLSLARALIHAPPIVILDEPFSSLDAASHKWLEGWIGELGQQGRAVCFTSHDEDQSCRLAKRQLELRDGRLRPLARRERGFVWCNSESRTAQVRSG